MLFFSLHCAGLLCILSKNIRFYSHFCVFAKVQNALCFTKKGKKLKKKKIGSNAAAYVNELERRKKISINIKGYYTDIIYVL